MQAIYKGGDYMEYNTTLFGEKRSVMTTVDGVEIRQFDIATQNISVQQGYDSGDFLPNTILPVDLRLWEIGEESILTKLSWYQNIDNVYSQWDSTDNRRVPMILSTAHVKTSSPAFDVQPTGSLYTLSSQCNYRNLITTNSVRPDAQYPVWYLQAPILTGTAPHFNVSPFILDFNYAGVLVLINVKTTTNTFTLKDYIDNNNNGSVITEVVLDFYYGDETHKINTNANHLEGGTASQIYELIGGCIINSKSYSVPSEIKSKINYALEEIQLASRLQSQTLDSYARQYPLISCMTPSTSLRCSVYKDGVHLDSNGYLIQHGDGKYNNDDFAWILKQVALLGFWFTTDSTNINTRVTGTGCTDVNTYLPEIKDGITTGRYWSGTAAAQQDAAAWGDDWREKVNYQPGGGSKEENDFGNLNTVLHRGSIAAGCKWYGLTEAQLNSLITWMNSGYQPASNDQFINDFKGVNPAEYITSITYLPFYPIPSGTDELINIGPLSTAVTGRKIAYEYGVTVDLGSYTLDRYFNDFRDFKPYTAISLYIPFCGTLALDPANYYNRTINVKLMIDMSTGSCTGLVFANDLLIDTIGGQCGVKIPLAAFNMGDYQNAIINAQYQLKQAEREKDTALIGIYAGAIIAGATASTGVGLLAGAAGIIYGNYKYNAAVDKIENIEYNIEHMQPKQTNISTGSPTNSLGMEYDARLIITRPTTLDTDINIYGHTVGYMTNKQGVLSDFSGFTQCSNVNLSGIPMTSSELASIHEALKSGVYLP